MSEKTHFVKKKVSGGPSEPKGEPFLIPNCFKNLRKLFILVFICQTFWAGTLSFMSGGPHGPKREPLFLPNRLKNLTTLFILVFICQPFWACTLSFIYASFVRFVRGDGGFLMVYKLLVPNWVRCQIGSGAKLSSNP